MNRKELEFVFCVEIGMTAFSKGLKCVPAMDKNIMSVISDNRRVLDTREVLKAWIAGWTKANLESEQPFNPPNDG